MNYTKEQQHFLSDLWTKESLKRLQLYQFNAGRRTLASGGCKRKELLRLLELIQEVKVFYKTFHWPIIEAFQMNCVVIFKTSFFDERLAGFALNLFCVEGSEYQKPVWLALCARSVAWQKKTAFTLAHICLDWIVETMHAVQEPAATKENTGLTLIFDWLCRASKITCVLKKGSEKSERWRPNTVNFR